MLTAAATVVELVAKFSQGGWLVFAAVALLVALFEAIHSTYRRIGAALHVGEIPDPPRTRHTLVVVPVGAVDRLTQEAPCAALSLGQDVRAVTVTHPDENDRPMAAKLAADWRVWNPHVPLSVLESPARSLTQPIVDHLCAVDAEDAHDRLVVLIPEMQLPRWWQRLLQNQRGAVLDRAIRRNTDAVIARLRFRIDAR